jgi:hypothetical protein
MNILTAQGRIADWGLSKTITGWARIQLEAFASHNK